MRITGGTKRGEKLVPWEDDGIRPMRDFVRSALFNIISELVEQCRFLDLFCGTGSVGIEALSRQAHHATFVDRSPDACRIARRNLDKLDFLGRSTVLQRDVPDALDALYRRAEVFDVVFVGPPYDQGLADNTLRHLGDALVLSPHAVVVAEISSRNTLDTTYGQLRLVDQRDYGDNSLYFYRPTVTRGPTTAAPSEKEQQND